MKHLQLAAAALAGGFALAMAGGAYAADTIKIGAQEPGGSFYSYAATFAKLIDDNKANDLITEIIPRGGAFGNPTAVNKGVADFGFTTSNTAAWARDGLQEVYKGEKAANIRTVTGAMQSAYTMILARKAYIDSIGNKSLEEMLKSSTPPRIGLKPTGSQVPIIADMVFKSLGTSLEELRGKGAITQAASGQITSMVTDGRLDLYIENAPAGQATITEMTLTNDMVFVPFPQKVLDDLKSAGLPTGVMAKDTFKGVTADYPNPVSATVLITGKDVPEKTVYNVLKTLVDNKTYIGEQHAALKGWDPAAGCQPENAVLPLHPGAEKLCKELGYLK
jgi:TRAP transporter TAXI family solute receptor